MAITVSFTGWFTPKHMGWWTEGDMNTQHPQHIAEKKPRGQTCSLASAFCKNKRPSWKAKAGFWLGLIPRLQRWKAGEFTGKIERSNCGKCWVMMVWSQWIQIPLFLEGRSKQYGSTTSSFWSVMSCFLKKAPFIAQKIAPPNLAKIH